MQRKLVRDFIREALYARGKGYFAVHDPIISPPGPILFNQLKGEHEFQTVLANLYRTRPQHWMTPVEIFQPHYSKAIGKFILSSLTSNSDTGDIVIYEIGGGNGTNAKAILDLYSNIPAIYDRIEYNLIEISSFLADRQDRLLRKTHKGKYSVHNEDFMKWSHHEIRPSFILGLEVLDNLPHDKVIFDGEKALQTVITPEGVEEYVPINDAYIEKTVAYHNLAEAHSRTTKKQPWSMKNYFYGDPIAERRIFEERLNSESPSHFFLPTGSVQLCETLFANFTAFTVFLADFDFLPIPNLNQVEVKSETDYRQKGQLKGCFNFPIVATQEIDLASYLQSPGNADVFFQTNFSLLKEIFTDMGKERTAADVYKSRDFLRIHADVFRTATRTGYNPLLEQFSNTSIFVGNSR